MTWFYSCSFFFIDSLCGLTDWRVQDVCLNHVFCLRIHPRDKQDVAYRLTLGARAVAYNEKDVQFLGPFPNNIMSLEMYVNITYDQMVSVTPSENIFEVSLAAGVSVN